jgi:hypothetical protein
VNAADGTVMIAHSTIAGCSIANEETYASNSKTCGGALAFVGATSTIAHTVIFDCRANEVRPLRRHAPCSQVKGHLLHSDALLFPCRVAAHAAQCTGGQAERLQITCQPYTFKIALPVPTRAETMRSLRMPSQVCGDIRECSTRAEGGAAYVVAATRPSSA